MKAETGRRNSSNKYIYNKNIEAEQHKTEADVIILVFNTIHLSKKKLFLFCWTAL